MCGRRNRPSISLRLQWYIFTFTRCRPGVCQEQIWWLLLCYNGVSGIVCVEWRNRSLEFVFKCVFLHEFLFSLLTRLWVWSVWLFCDKSSLYCCVGLVFWWRCEERHANVSCSCCVWILTLLYSVCETHSKTAFTFSPFISMSLDVMCFRKVYFQRSRCWMCLLENVK